MIPQEKVQIILGPPGTGKTTTLLNLVDKYLMEGVAPDKICFLSFTRKAAHEAMGRACEKFNLQPNQLPFFKTLHSLAFNQLGIQRSQVMGFGHYLDLARLLGMPISMKGIGEDGLFQGYLRGDRLLFTEGLARIRCVGLRDLWDEQFKEDLDILELEQLRDTILEYKRINDKVDFTDLIHQFVEKRPMPPMQVLIVDEAQDLSRCQWNMISCLAEMVDRVHIAGDDDQAIYRWAGADVDTLIGMRGTTTVLDQSYRVPRKIALLALEIIGRCGNRLTKIWNPRDVDGEIEYIPGHEVVDMSKGNWLLLARNVHFLERYETYCAMNGFLYDSPGGNPLNTEAWEVVRCWERLRAGKEINISEAIKVYGYLSTKERVKYGSKKLLKAKELEDPATMVTMDVLWETYGLCSKAIWHEALDKLAPDDVKYFLAALRKGEKMGQKPRIKISTIHAVKGGEADNVVLCTDMAPKTFQEMQDNPDDEARVWYVAITRAKEKLFIIQPQTMRHYDL